MAAHLIRLIGRQDFMKTYIKIIILGIIFGGLSGVVLDRALLPYLSTLDGFKKYDFLKRTVESTTIINKTEQVVMKDGQNVFEIFNKINPAIVSIADKTGATLGAGAILTSDGIIVVPTDIVFGVRDYREFSVIFSDSSREAPKTVKNSGLLAIIKVDKSNLSVAGIADRVRSGEKIVALGRGTNEEKEIISAGIVNYLNSNNNTFYTDAKNYPALYGAGIFNSKGEMMGINVAGPNTEYIQGLLLPKIDELIKI